MSTKEKNIPVIKFEKMTCIKYESPKEFLKSASWEAYKKALEITQEIVADNKDYLDSLSKNDNGTQVRNTEQIYNIIFFTGDRGTGKTSVMLSYMEFLKDYYRKYSKSRNDNIQEMTFEEDKLMFTGLEYIDASTLDAKEDILGGILSKMLKKWSAEEKRSYGNRGLRKEDDYAYKKRQVQMRFNQVYKYLKNLRSERDIMDEDSDMFMETLENMSLTENLRQAFQQLVEDYLDIMEYPGSERDISSGNHFLVVSIDDLDLNIDKGFELLDQVRKYLMIPQIVILLSANCEQLEKVCVNYYTSKFDGIKNEINTKKYIAKLASDYLEKMVPTQRQVILCSGDKWDYFDEKDVELIYSDSKRKGVQRSGSLLEIVQGDMKNYLGAEILKGGKALVYLTPDTLRELCSWVKEIYELEETEEMEPGKEEEIYAENLKWFWNKKFSGLINKYLNLEEKKIFATIETLESAKKIRFLKEQFKKENKADLKESLMEILNGMRWGTIEEQRVASLLILYFTVKLSGILISLSWLVGQKRKVRINELMAYYDKGIWGKWERDMIRPFFKKTGEETLFVKIAYTEWVKENESLSLELEGNYNRENWRNVCEFVEKNKEVLMDYQYLLLFYKLNQRNNISEKKMWEISFAGDEKTGGENKRIIRVIQNCGGLFCLSNIVLNLMEGAELSKKFAETLPDILNVNGERVAKEGWEKLTNRISVFKQKEEGLEKWLHEPILPLGNMEYIINLGEKIQKSMDERMVEELNDENISAKIRRFFGIIKEDLEGYDDPYYAERFGSCPPIKKILEGDEKLMNILSQSIKCHIIPYTPNQEEKEWRNT